MRPPIPAIATGLLLANLAHAQQPAPALADADQLDKQYRVEMLVVANPEVPGDELWREPQLAWPGRMIDPLRSPRIHPQTPVQLAGARDTLAASGYEVLWHRAWIQPGWSRASGPWLRVSGGAPVGDWRTLEGAVQVYLSRYLHIRVNLWHRQAPDSGVPPAAPPPLPVPCRQAPAQPPTAAPRHAANPGDIGGRMRGDYCTQASMADLVWLEQPGMPTPEHAAHLVHFTTSRKLALDQIHYLDHPHLGILIRITAVNLDTRAPLPPAPADTTPWHHPTP